MGLLDIFVITTGEIFLAVLVEHVGFDDLGIVGEQAERGAQPDAIGDKGPRNLYAELRRLMVWEVVQFAL